MFCVVIFRWSVTQTKQLKSQVLQFGDVRRAWHNVIIVCTACSGRMQSDIEDATPRGRRQTCTTKDAATRLVSTPTIRTRTELASRTAKSLVYWWINCSGSRSRRLVRGTLLLHQTPCCCNRQLLKPTVHHTPFITNPLIKKFVCVLNNSSSNRTEITWMPLNLLTSTSEDLHVSTVLPSHCRSDITTVNK